MALKRIDEMLKSAVPKAEETVNQAVKEEKVTILDRINDLMQDKLAEVKETVAEVKEAAEKVEDKAEEKAEEAKKELLDVTTVARQVIKGKWGNGSERKKRLAEAGYDYATVQKKVNELLAARRKK